MSKISFGRAFTAYVAQRVIRLATQIAVLIFVASVVASALLVYFFSPWWWLLAVPFAVLLIMFLVVRIILGFIIRRIYPSKFTATQATDLKSFVDKIQSLLEARATPPWVFVAVSIKDLLLHRDVVTIKAIITDTSSLKSDYKALEKLF